MACRHPRYECLGAAMRAANKQGYFRFKDDWLQRLAGNPRLSSADIAIGITLCLHMNRKTQMAWPSFDRLAACTGRNASTVWRSICRLEQEGHLTIDRGRGRHTSNRYRFPLKDCEGAVFSKTAPPQ